MKEEIAAILQDFGDRVELLRDGAPVTVRAFLQPVTSKSWQNMEHVFNRMGRIERGQYLYLGPIEQPIYAGDQLRCHGVRYIVRKAECIRAADEELYQWALCVRKGGEDPWNS